jgi:hypothetical protein
VCCTERGDAAGDAARAGVVAECDAAGRGAAVARLPAEEPPVVHAAVSMTTTGNGHHPRPGREITGPQ